MKLLHLTQEQYAEVLDLAYRAQIDGDDKGFVGYMTAVHRAERYTENVIHIVRLIHRGGDRYWEWCPRCERFVNLWTTETWGREVEIEKLSQELKGV